MIGQGVATPRHSNVTLATCGRPGSSIALHLASSKAVR